MDIFGIRLDGLTLLVCSLEFGLMCHQLWRCLCRSGHVRAFCTALLLLLLLFHNLSMGLWGSAPDWIPEMARHLLANGSAYAVAGFIPFYFYRGFGLSALRFHAYGGACCFLLLPFVLFHGLVYPLSGRLELATGYGMLVPLGYWLVMLSLLWGEARQRGCRLFWLEFAALLPWALLGLVVHLGGPAWLRVLLANGGFLLVGFWSLARELRWNRRRAYWRERARMDWRELFSERCRRFGLTERESEVALLLCQGMSYREAGDSLFISGRTVDSHAQRIFAKTGVNRKMDLREALGFSELAMAI